MLDSKMFVVNQNKMGGRGGRIPVDMDQARSLAGQSVESFLATGLSSRGGPNKESNKLKRCSRSYLYM
jgi:hypothetical protein